MGHKPLRVTVIDMQPITPAVGGGRQRLLGLYHALGPNIECTYVGSYDWPGESYRDQQLTPELREIVVPLSDTHHEAAKALSQQLGGCTVIDIAFPEQVELSPDFLHVAREHILDADVVVFSHPWCFPPLADALHPNQLVVYDSHNVEALLRVELLDDMEAAKESAAELVVRTEQALLARADLLLACSEEDVVLFQQIFDADPFKLRVVPNGTFVDRFPESSEIQRQALRGKLKLPLSQPVAIFLGSAYGPNNQAARFIVQHLATACPYVLFVIAGGVGDTVADIPAVDNVMITGRVDDARRDELLLAANLALNPMSAGSGTNIKMFDYMAAGLPVLTTEIGARGIGTSLSAPTGIFVEPLANFAVRCSHLATTVLVEPALRQAVRSTVRRQFSWERISIELGKLFRATLAHHRSRAGHYPRVALMTTWNIACGIGEHANYLTREMETLGAELVVLGNTLVGHQPLGFERDLHTAVSRVWRWDNVTWHSTVDHAHMDSVLRLARPDLLLIQHHTAYASFQDVEAVVESAREKGIQVVIEMHNARDVPAEQKDRLCAAGARLAMHHADGMADISPPHKRCTTILPLPVRQSVKRQDFGKRMRTASPVVAGFGFLRPYKGLKTLIGALALLKRKYPGIRYHGLHANYPGDISESYLNECRAIAAELGIPDVLEIETKFLPIEEVDVLLSAVDILVMPYSLSNEDASSAVNQALVSGRPVVVSPFAIFKSVSDAVFVASRHDPEAYAEAIDRVLSDPALESDLVRRASNWAEQHSYARAARTFLGFGRVNDATGEGIEA